MLSLDSLSSLSSLLPGNLKKIHVVGPFIGEFGWEVLFWQGYIKKLLKSKSENEVFLVLSRPGYQPFYDGCDFFFPLDPSEVVSKSDLQFIPRGYICDSWNEIGLPLKWKPKISEKLKTKALQFLKLDTVLYEPSIKHLFETKMVEILKCLSESGVELNVICPWWKPINLGNIQAGLTAKHSYQCPAQMTVSIPFKEQSLEFIGRSVSPLERDKAGFRITILPRWRPARRSDKDWPLEKYEELILKLNDSLPNLEVIQCGTPNEALDLTKSSKLKSISIKDLINVPDNERLARHIASFKSSDLVLGPMSGAILVSLAAGAPSLCWGYPQDALRYYYENFTDTEFIYLPEMEINVERLLKGIAIFLRRRGIT